MDLNSAVGRAHGLTPEHIAAIEGFRQSLLSTAAEKAAMAYAQELTKTPTPVSDEVFAELRRHFDDDQIIDLSATIALENYRARMNRGLDVGSDDFCGLGKTHPVGKTAAIHA